MSLAMDERDNARQRKEIVVALLYAAEHAPELLRVCDSVDGDFSETRTAIAEAFAINEVQADAILNMQVRRFTPHALEQLRAELDEINAVLGE